MENKAHALAAGAFVLVVAALLVAMAWWLTREGGVRVNYELSSRDAVTGLSLQATVRFKGVQVGKVTAISFDPKVPGNVLVRIAVDTNAPDHTGHLWHARLPGRHRHRACAARRRPRPEDAAGVGRW